MKKIWLSEAGEWGNTVFSTLSLTWTICPYFGVNTELNLVILFEKKLLSEKLLEKTCTGENDVLSLRRFKRKAFKKEAKCQWNKNFWKKIKKILKSFWNKKSLVSLQPNKKRKLQMSSFKDKKRLKSAKVNEK